MTSAVSQAYQKIKSTGLLNKSIHRFAPHHHITNNHNVSNTNHTRHNGSNELPPSYDASITHANDDNDPFSIPQTHHTIQSHTNNTVRQQHKNDRSYTARNRLDELMLNFNTLTKNQQFDTHVSMEAEKLGIPPGELLIELEYALISGTIQQNNNNVCDHVQHNKVDDVAGVGSDVEDEYIFTAKPVQATSDNDTESSGELSDTSSDNQSLISKHNINKNYSMTTKQLNQLKLQRLHQREPTNTTTNHHTDKASPRHRINRHRVNNISRRSIRYGHTRNDVSDNDINHTDTEPSTDIDIQHTNTLTNNIKSNTDHSIDITTKSFSRKQSTHHKTIDDKNKQSIHDTVDTIPPLPVRCAYHRHNHQRCPIDCTARWNESELIQPDYNIIKLYIQQDIKPGHTPVKLTNVSNATTHTNQSPLNSVNYTERNVIDSPTISNQSTKTSTTNKSVIMSDDTIVSTKSPAKNDSTLADTNKSIQFRSPSKMKSNKPVSTRRSTDTNKQTVTATVPLLPHRCTVHQRNKRKCPIDCEVRWNEAKQPMPSDDILQLMMKNELTTNRTPKPSIPSTDTNIINSLTAPVQSNADIVLNNETANNNTTNKSIRSRNKSIRSDIRASDESMNEPLRISNAIQSLNELKFASDAIAANNHIVDEQSESVNDESIPDNQQTKITDNNIITNAEQTVNATNTIDTTDSQSTDNIINELPSVPPRCSKHKRAHGKCPIDCVYRWNEAKLGVPPNDTIQLPINHDNNKSTKQSDTDEINKLTDGLITDNSIVSDDIATPIKIRAQSNESIIDISNDNNSTTSQSTAQQASINNTSTIERSRDPIQLTQWYVHLHALQLDDRGKPYVLLKGSKIGAGPWSSGVITDIIDSKTVVTASGRQYVLYGDINSKLASKLLSPESIQLFIHGFPLNWLDILVNEVNRCKLLHEQDIDYNQYNTTAYEQHQQQQQQQAKLMNNKSNKSTTGTNQSIVQTINGKSRSTTKPNGKSMNDNKSMDRTISPIQSIPKSNSVAIVMEIDTDDTVPLSTDHKRRRTGISNTPYYVTTDVDVIALSSNKRTPHRSKQHKSDVTHKQSSNKSHLQHSIQYIEPSISELDSLGEIYKSRSGRTSIKPINHWETERIVNGMLVKGNIDLNTISPYIKKTKHEYNMY